MLELLTTGQTAHADRLAAQAGVATLTLMESAGHAVAQQARHMLRGACRQAAHSVLVLCGPGNNGGDGFVAARLLARQGCRVEVALLGSPDALRGDAAAMAQRWNGLVVPMEDADPTHADLVIDAMFGAGLSRPLDSVAGDTARRLNASGRQVLAVDVPSGVDGNSGPTDGPCVQASRTVTFFRRKPAHLLANGRDLCGEVIVADIGIPAAVLDTIKPTTYANGPELWRSKFPWPKRQDHKYRRGHALVLSGPPYMTGAARLAARGALRGGAGLVTVATRPDAVGVNAAHLTAVMVRPFGDMEGWRRLAHEPRVSVLVVGPGCEPCEDTRQCALAALSAGPAVILDAGALAAFEHRAGELKSAISLAGSGTTRPVVITPHEGEFFRLFNDIPDVCNHRNSLDRARAAARYLSAVVVLKGSDTVIAACDGRAAINENAPPWLATAGSGDVLAGLIAGLLSHNPADPAERMPAFEAAAAAVWLHGACASQFGPGLIAEDLPDLLPGVLTRLARATAADMDISPRPTGGAAENAAGPEHRRSQ